MDKIKIIDFITTARGAERLLRSRVRKINSTGYFYNIILCPEGEELAEIKKENIPLDTIDITRTISALGLIKEIILLFSIIKKEKIDIIHTHNSKAGALGRIVCFLLNFTKKKKIKIIHQVHGFHFTRYNGVKKRFFFIIEKILAKITDVLLFQNKAEYEIAQKKFQSKKTKLALIGNGINFDELSQKRQNVEVKDIDKTNKIIICIARIEPVKNHIMLVESLGILKKYFSNFIAYFIGEGSDKQLIHSIKNLDLEDNIIFTGALNRTEIVYYLSIADISVLTSLKEGMPRSLMESMFFGIPCIGTNVIGTTEVIVDNETGFLVGLNDNSAFSGKIYELLTDEEKRKAMGKKAEIFCKENFDENRVTEKIIDVYKKIMENP